MPLGLYRPLCLRSPEYIFHLRMYSWYGGAHGLNLIHQVKYISTTKVQSVRYKYFLDGSTVLGPQ